MLYVYTSVVSISHAHAHAHAQRKNTRPPSPQPLANLCTDEETMSAPKDNGRMGATPTKGAFQASSLEWGKQPRRTQDETHNSVNTHSDAHHDCAIACVNHENRTLWPPSPSPGRGPFV